MNILKFRLLIISCFSIFISSCSNGFKKANDQLKYKFIQQANKPVSNPDSYFYYGEILVMDIEGNKIMCDNIEPNFYFISSLKEQKYAGDFINILPLTSVSDSLLIKTQADSFFHFYYKSPTPGCIKNNEVMLSLKIQNILSEEAYQAKIQQSKTEVTEKAITAFDKYLRDNNVNEAPEGFGIVRQISNPGKGRSIIFGDEVEIHFEQSIMDGKLIQSTYQTGETIHYIVGGDGGVGALDFGLNGLKIGGKATIYAPYFTAFGEKGLGTEIPPYSNMIFKVEVVSIK